jgi:hypothetical protein
MTMERDPKSKVSARVGKPVPFYSDVRIALYPARMQVSCDAPQQVMETRRHMVGRAKFHAVPQHHSKT